MTLDHLVETPRTTRSVSLPETGEDWVRSPLGLYLPTPPTRAERYDRPVAVDLFCGAGGMSLGLHQAGFHVAAAVELDYWSAITYTVNLARPGVQFHFDTEDRRAGFDKHVRKHLGLAGRKKGLVGSDPAVMPPHLAGDGWISSQPSSERGCEQFFLWDVKTLTGQHILDALGLEVGEVDLVAGGPPCQGFSMAGRRNVHDPRNSLVFEFARLVIEMQPKAMAMENVPAIAAMTTPDGALVIDELTAYLESGGIGTVANIKQGLLASSGVGVARTIHKEARTHPEGGRSRRKRAEQRGRAGEPEQTEMFAEAAP